MDYAKIAQEVVEAVGGKENIVAAAHCATRLRLVLKDDNGSSRFAKWMELW